MEKQATKSAQKPGDGIPEFARKMTIKSEGEIAASLKNSLLVDGFQTVSGAVNQRMGGDIVDNPGQATGFGSLGDGCCSSDSQIRLPVYLSPT